MQYYSDKQRHVVCIPYSIPNLHAMAQALGIKRSWYHIHPYPHYDIPKYLQQHVADHSFVVSPKRILEIVKGNGEYTDARQIQQRN